MMRHDLARTACQAVFLAICLSILLGSQSITADDSPKPKNPKSGDTMTSKGIVHQSDLIYRRVNGKTLMSDVVFPQSGDRPFPAVILLHGSGPANKGKKGMAPLAEELARKGYVGVAVSYRCKPEDNFPAPLQDVQGAIDWVRANAGQYKLDKDRIAVIGFSGGGTLACLLGMKGDTVRAVVSLYAPTDFLRLHECCLTKSQAKECGLWEKTQSSYIMKTLESWLGGPPSKVPERYRSASPISQAGKNSAPILLIHGADDTTVPVEQSQALAKQLLKSGRPVTLLIVEGAGHDFEEKNRTDGRLAFAAVLAFLDEHLRAPAFSSLGESRAQK